MKSGQSQMSRVFLAEETRFKRRVVIKVLSPELAAGLSAERFEREIALAAGLQQANIVPVITAGDVDGLPWYSMPYVDGESLRARLDRGAIPPGEAVKILGDVARALAYAHEGGIVHRDVKPENILLSGGAAVVTDFGIAKAVSASKTKAPGGTLTQIGTSIGTPAYMAPEQAVGDDVDQRADIYSFGVVAYEMLTQRHPFSGKTTAQQLIAAHIGETPDPIRNTSREMSAAIPAIVMGALAKDPSKRPQNAQALLDALDAPRGTQVSRARLTAMIAAGVLVVVALGWLGWRQAASRAAIPGSDAGRTLAILPFTNVGGDTSQQYFADGLADELTTAVTKIPGLQTASRNAAFSARIRGMSSADAGRALHVGNVLEGTVRRAGARVRLSARLLNVSNGLAVWSDEFEHTGTDVFAAQDDLTNRVATALHKEMAVASRAETHVARGTKDPAVYELYLEGRFHFQKRGGANMRRALALFEEAIRRDSAFARAYASLALTQITLPNYETVNAQARARWTAVAARNAGRALQLDSTLADAHIVLALDRGERWQFADSHSAFRKAIAFEPGNALAHQWFGEALYFAGDMLTSLEELERAQQLDPFSSIIASGITFDLAMLGRLDEAVVAWRRALVLDSTFVQAYEALGFSYLLRNNADTAIALARHGLVIDPRGPNEPILRDLLIAALVRAGHRDEANAVFADLRRDSETARPYAVGVAYAVMGDREKAIQWLTRAVDAHDPDVVEGAMVCEPILAPLHDDPRYKALLVRVGLTTCRTK